MTDESYDRGLQVRREVLGDEHVDGALSSAAGSPIRAAFQDYVTRCAWGEVWAREQLDRRTRSAITLAVLCALGRERELGQHALAARRNGLSDEEIGEVLLHTAVYAGAPAANSGLAAVAEALEGGGER